MKAKTNRIFPLKIYEFNIKKTGKGEEIVTWGDRQQKKSRISLAVNFGFGFW